MTDEVWMSVHLVMFVKIPPVELLADLLREKPVEETGYDAIIVVDNAPKVGTDRMGKLKSVLNKVFGRFGEIVSQEYPVDGEGVFKGCVPLSLSHTLTLSLRFPSLPQCTIHVHCIYVCSATL